MRTDNLFSIQICSSAITCLDVSNYVFNSYHDTNQEINYEIIHLLYSVEIN